MPAHLRPSDRILQPGEYAVGDASCRFRTLLGSCVSITLWHRPTRLGAMSHFLLASRAHARSEERDPRYGEEALALMVDALAERAVDVRQCEAKIFGGGNMFPGQVRSGGNIVGTCNGRAAKTMLEALGIRIGAQSLFGDGHRQVVFDIATGDVWVRRNRSPGVQPFRANAQCA